MESVIAAHTAERLHERSLIPRCDIAAASAANRGSPQGRAVQTRVEKLPFSCAALANLTGSELPSSTVAI